MEAIEPSFIIFIFTCQKGLQNILQAVNHRL